MKNFFLLLVIFVSVMIGRNTFAQWMQGNGIYGGTVTALASSVNTVFAGTYKNGIYYSNDNGSTWIQTSLNNKDVQAIAISGNTIYAGIYDDGSGSMTSGVYRSSDFGVTWTQTSFNYQTVNAIGINGSTIYIGADDGVYYSTDNGTTWLPTALTNESFYSFAFSGTTIFAGGGAGLHISTDNGTTWTQNPVVNDLVWAIAISGTNVFAGTYFYGVYRSSNLGATWTQTTLNYQETHAIHIIGANIYAGTIYEGVYLSSDNGLTWAQTSMTDKNVDALTSINSTLFAGLWAGGVYLTNDNGTNWSQTALNNDDVRSFISSGNNMFAGSATNGIYKSTNSGQNWTQHAIENIPVVTMGTHSNYLFAGCDYSGIYRSADNGETWTQSGLGIESVYSIKSLNTAVFAATLNLVGSGKVYKSTNNGGTWTQSTPTLNNRNFVSLAVLDTTLFAGTFFFNLNNPNDPTRYGIYKSDDNGITWTQTTLNNKNVWSLAANGSTVFAGTFELFTIGSGVYRSIDNGQTWVQTSLNDRNVYSIVIAQGKVYAGTDNGIYMSEDNGTNWTMFNEGFSSNPLVYGLFATNDYLFAGTDVNSAWYRELSGTTTFQLSVNVTNGWNMVSIPGLHPTDQNVNTWWVFRDPGANVFRYAGGYQTVTDAVPGTGYWMKHAGALTYNTGEEWPAGGIQIVPHAPLTAASGWNLFGGYELVVTAANVTTNPQGLQSGPIYAYSGGYQVATTLNPGYGYWIKLNAAGQIIIPETFAKDSNPVDYFPDNWGRITLTDATGISYTLYAVKGQVDLSQYELPPAPPAGMFDIRYESGRIAEDINSSIRAIDMSGVTYPLTVRVEGMDIRLMDESGKMINTNLKSGENVVIDNSTIQKLRVTGELLPTVYSLVQNYPNPFNPSTVIEFSLPEDVANVKLSIYNALGEKVAELVNTSLQAGRYQYQWNAGDVATGMYIYELRTDKLVSVKKMLLLK